MLGRTVLVTGAAGHLGRAMTSSLAEAGARVLVNGRDRERVLSLVDEMVAQGLEAEAAVFDVTDDVAVKRFFDGFQGRTLHALINNAYVGGAGLIESSKENSYASSYEVTVVAAHRLLLSALPGLRRASVEEGGASVVNLASMYAMVSPDQRIYESPNSVNPPFYGAAKAALLQWTRYAACEFGKEGIRVNAISPGPFPSAAVMEEHVAFVEKLAHKVPLGRVARAVEIGGPVLFLASPASSFVNGANIVVDGGWTCW